MRPKVLTTFHISNNQNALLEHLSDKSRSLNFVSKSAIIRALLSLLPQDIELNYETLENEHDLANELKVIICRSK